MKGVHVDLSRLSARNRAVLEERAQQLANPRSEEVVGSGAGEYVGFRLNDVACAVNFAAVARVFRKLGQVVPLAERRQGLAGIAFLENQPCLVLDLHLTAGHARAPDMLAFAPGLLLRASTGSYVVAVDGPTELLDATRVIPHVGVNDDNTTLRLAGRLDDGTCVIDPVWLLKWAEARCA